MSGNEKVHAICYGLMALIHLSALLGLKTEPALACVHAMLVISYLNRQKG